MTSLDFSSYGDSYIKAMVYNELLYVSIGSGNSSVNYWLGELFLSTGEVIRSKWFQVYLDVLVKPTYFDLILLSEAHMVTVQYYDKVLKLFTSIFIFDKNTFTPLKKIDFHWWLDYIVNNFYINNKFYIFGQNNYNIHYIIIDDSLNFKKSVKIFDSSYDLQYSNKFRVVLFDSSFIIAESAPIKGLYLSTGSNLIFHKISLDFDSLSWENFQPTFDEFPSVEMNSMLNESDQGLSYTYFKSKYLWFNLIYRHKFKFIKSWQFNDTICYL